MCRQGVIQPERLAMERHARPAAHTLNPGVGEGQARAPLELQGHSMSILWSSMVQNGANPCEHFDTLNDARMGFCRSEQSFKHLLPLSR
jgi:hypothetical protein